MDPQPILFRYTLIVRDLPNLTYLLPMAPDGWSENNINWSRDPKFFGLVRKFTTQLKFIEDGARILRQEWYTYRLFGNVKIIIEKRNNQWGYDEVYYGQIDFSNVVSQKDYFVANAINLDIAANISAYADTTYEIPLDSDAVLVEVPPLRFFESAQLLIEASQSLAEPGFPAIRVITNEVNASQASVQDQGYFHSFTPDFSTLPNWFFHANTDTTLKINLSGFTGNTVAGLGVQHFQIQFVRSDGTVLANIVDTTHSLIQSFNVTQDYSFTIPEGQSVYLYMRCDDDISGFFLTTGTLQLSYFTSTPASSIHCFKAIDLFKKIIKKINQDVEYPITSNYLNAIDGLLLTSGEFIRNITTKTVVTEEVIDGEDVTTIIVLPYTPVMKTSLNDFYQSVRALSKKSNYGCAMGVENNTLRFEDLSYFFKSAVRICRLGNIKDYEDTPYIEYIFNNINAGYPDQTYNSQLNGRYEINSVQVYTTPIIQIGDSKKTLDLTSIYRGDPYGIEQIRVLETDTTNDYSDNDTFFLDCTKDGDTYSVLTAASFTNVTGTLAGNSLYNLDITPKRNLLRNGGFLRSALDADGYLIRFASGEKNTGVTSINPDGVFADEHANIDIASLPTKIFMPIQVTITTDYPKDMIQLLDAFIGGYIEFEYRGATFKGFPIDVTTDITKNSSKQIKLLMLPNQDLSALIHPVRNLPFVAIPIINTATLQITEIVSDFSGADSWQININAVDFNAILGNQLNLITEQGPETIISSKKPLSVVVSSLYSGTQGVIVTVNGIEYPAIYGPNESLSETIIVDNLNGNVFVSVKRAP